MPYSIRGKQLFRKLVPQRGIYAEKMPEIGFNLMHFSETGEKGMHFSTAVGTVVAKTLSRIFHHSLSLSLYFSLAHTHIVSLSLFYTSLPTDQSSCTENSKSGNSLP